MVTKRRRKVRRHRGAGLRRFQEGGRLRRYRKRRYRGHRGEGILGDALKFIGLDILL